MSVPQAIATGMNLGAAGIFVLLLICEIVYDGEARAVGAFMLGALWFLFTAAVVSGLLG